MDNTLTSVLAALSGSMIGASTPVLSNFVLQRSVAQRELTNRELAQREELYSEFIRQGTGCYAKALSQSLENIDELVAMYATGESNQALRISRRTRSRRGFCNKTGRKIQRQKHDHRANQIGGARATRGPPERFRA